MFLSFNLQYLNMNGEGLLRLGFLYLSCFLTAREKRDSNEARVCYCLCVPESQTCGTLSGAKDFARFISLK